MMRCRRYRDLEPPSVHQLRYRVRQGRYYEKYEISPQDMGYLYHHSLASTYQQEDTGALRAEHINVRSLGRTFELGLL